MPSVPVQISVPNIADALLYFDSMEVQKSVAGTPYSDAVSLTAVHARGASALGTGTVFTHLAGTVLNLDVSGTGLTHTFVGPNPMTISAILRELRNLTLVDATNSSGQLKLTTEALGIDQRLTILAGTANEILGFTEGQSSFGLDVNIDLLPSVEKYTFLDRTYPFQDGWYRVRFVNTTTGRTDSWQSWFLGPGTVAVDPASLVSGYVKLATLDGKVQEGAEVTVINTYSPHIQDAYFIAGASVTKKTDSTGTATFDLVKGSLVDVVIEGTSVIRRIQVPVTTPFDMLDPDLQLDDPFGIQEPDLPAAVRHS